MIQFRKLKPGEPKPEKVSTVKKRHYTRKKAAAAPLPDRHAVPPLTRKVRDA
jgi:hypothetical protein